MYSCICPTDNLVIGADFSYVVGKPTPRSPRLQIMRIFNSTGADPEVRINIVAIDARFASGVVDHVYI